MSLPMQDVGGKRPAEESGPDTSHKRAKESFEEPEATLRILVQSRDAGGIIGKAGMNIKRLRSEYSAVINIPDTNNPERVLTITATLGNVMKVLEECLPKLGESSDAKDPDVQFLVQQSQVGSIIGRAGFKIKELREATGARIKVFQECLPRSTDRVIAIGGNTETITKCVEEVLRILEETPIKGQPILYDPSTINDLPGNWGGGSGGYGGGYGAQGGSFFGQGMRGGGTGGRGGTMGGRGAARGGRGTGRGGTGMRGGGRGGRGGNMGAGNMGAGNMGGNNGGNFGGNMGGGNMGNNNMGGNSLGGGNMNSGGFDQSLMGSNFGDGSNFQGDNFQGNFQDNSQFGGFQQSGGGEGPTQTTQVTIPQDLAGSIIGKGGLRIKRIRQTCGATIKIDDVPPGQTDRLITITGTQDQINHAQYLLQQSVRMYSGSKF